MAIHGKRLGFLLPTKEGIMGGVTPRGADVIALARQAEAIGLDSVWLVDHFLHEPYADEAQWGHPMAEEAKGVKVGFWECWTLAAAIAVTTGRVEIGTLVSNTGYRNPALLARMADTVDELSAGRLIMGLGAGDFPSEYQAFGYPWERRVGRFEEALQIIAPLMRGETVSFEGEFYRVAEAELRPKGGRPQGPPILIGLLEGGPRMRRLVAQYADHWSCWLAGGRVYEDCYRTMVQACEKHDRDPATLVKNATIAIRFPGHVPDDPSVTPFTGSVESLAAQLGTFLENDVDHVVVWLEPMSSAGLDSLGEVLARL